MNNKEYDFKAIYKEKYLHDLAEYKKIPRVLLESILKLYKYAPTFRVEKGEAIKNTDAERHLAYFEFINAIDEVE